LAVERSANDRFAVTNTTDGWSQMGRARPLDALSRAAAVPRIGGVRVFADCLSGGPDVHGAEANGPRQPIKDIRSDDLIPSKQPLLELELDLPGGIALHRLVG